MAAHACCTATIPPELSSPDRFCTGCTVKAQAARSTWRQEVPACLLIAMCVTQGGSWTVAYTGPDAATKLRQLRPGAVYEYRVSASNCEGTSAYSEAAAHAQPLLPPPPPTTVAAQLDAASPASSEWGTCLDATKPFLLT